MQDGCYVLGDAWSTIFDDIFMAPWFAVGVRMRYRFRYPGAEWSFARTIQLGDIFSEGQIVAKILEAWSSEPSNTRRASLAPGAGGVMVTATPGSLLAAAGYSACALVPTTRPAVQRSTYIDVGRFG
jgi:hypothetical protein